MKEPASQQQTISTKQLLESISIVVQYCQQQRGCQNCILRAFGCDHWNCQIDAFDLRDVLDNIKAKKKNHGYI